MHRPRLASCRVSRSLDFPRRGELKTRSSNSGAAWDTDNKSRSGHENHEFYPSMEDVVQVRDILRRLGPRGQDTTVPDEIVDMIFDEAEYWPSVLTTLVTTPVKIGRDGDTECLRTPPLCFSLPKESKEVESSKKNETQRTVLHRGVHPCRKIVFDISSRDQGWGGERSHKGTYQCSWTWFDAYITPWNQNNSAPRDREDHKLDYSDSESERRSESSHPRPFLPEPTRLQCNRTATEEFTDFHIVWHYKDDIQPDSAEAERIQEEEGRGRATLDGRAVRKMEIGDQVVVWMRARFPGWQNRLSKMSVRVFWAA